MNQALVLKQSDFPLLRPVGSLDAYVQAVSAIPVLSAAEETEFVSRLQRGNTVSAGRQ